MEAWVLPAPTVPNSAGSVPGPGAGWGEEGNQNAHAHSIKDGAELGQGCRLNPSRHGMDGGRDYGVSPETS